MVYFRITQGYGEIGWEAWLYLDMLLVSIVLLILNYVFLLETTGCGFEYCGKGKVLSRIACSTRGSE